MTAAQDPVGPVLTGQAWDEFCDTLKRAGQQILRPEAAASELDRAEGWRYLTRLLRIGLEMHLEFADPDFPGFFLPSHETGKIGADNPDNHYLFARINGRNEYVIRGERGTVPYLSFGTQKGGYETNGLMEQTGFIEAKDLQLDADGRFELVLSADQRPGNWLRIEPESNSIVVRQTFNDRSKERAATMRISRLGAGAQPRPLTAAQLQAGLRNAAAFTEGTARVFADWAQGYLPHVNQLPPANQLVCQRTGGDPNIFYYHSAWELEEDQALVIHLPRVPECRFWNLQINNWWMESLDYRYHNIHVNKYSAKHDADGGVTIVLSQRDPGLPNWLETTGHRRGTMCLRWVAAKEHIHPETRVVRVADLKA